MTDREAMKMALEALEDSMYPQKKQFDAIVGLKQALAQPEQEPFGYFQLDLRMDAWVQNRTAKKGVAFYTAPPSKPVSGMDECRKSLQEKMNKPKTLADYAPNLTAPPPKPWVGLTDEEIKGILDCGRGGLVDIKKAEQILKERNNG